MTKHHTGMLSKDDRRRLSEIISVLRKHEVTKGLSPEKLRKILEDLGPTFVKVGQILSMRPELIPPAYCKELENLRTDVAAMPETEVKSIIEQELHQSCDTLFSSFDPEPIGSASIAQVHKAILKDGQVVAVKVQRPHIYKTMERDIMLIRRLDRIVRLSSIGKVIDLNMVLDELWNSAKEEMDFHREADHLERFAKNNKDIVYVSCPKCFRELSTGHLLTMSFESGIPIDNVPLLTEYGYSTNEIARKLVSNYIKQILEDRFFQADPHPGNLAVKNGKIIWLDMGMMGEISEFDAGCYRSVLNAVLEHDYEAMKNVVLLMGVCSEPIDENLMVEDFARFIRKYEKMALSEINLGNLMNEAVQLASSYKIRMPAGVTMVSRGITTLEGLLEIIAPDVSVISVLATDHSMLLPNDLDLKKETLSLLKDLAFSGRDMAKIPAQISHTLERVETGKVKFKIEPVNLEKPMSSIHFAARKLAGGLIAAALIIAAAIIYSSSSGIPIYSIVLMAIGILLGIWTLFSK